MGKSPLNKDKEGGGGGSSKEAILRHWRRFAFPLIFSLPGKWWKKSFGFFCGEIRVLVYSPFSSSSFLAPTLASKFVDGKRRVSSCTSPSSSLGPKRG